MTADPARDAGVVRHRASSPIAAVAVLACVGATLPRFLFDEAASIRHMPFVPAVFATAWWLIPLVVFLLGVRSSVVLVAGAVGYVLTAGLSLAATYRNDHSTAAFGIYFVPPLLIVGVVLLLVVDRLFDRP